MTRRREVLRAVQEASALVRDHPVGPRSSFDLIDLVQELNIPVMFRPLDGLVGAAVTVGDQTGILIDSRVPRRRQRFTLAHEVGHIVLGHENKFDETVGTNLRLGTGGSGSSVEAAADTFASELLGPRGLIQETVNRYEWELEDLQDPRTIYQLSLRLGMSFKATCWKLLDLEVLPEQKATRYATQRDIVKETKLRIIDQADLPNPHADVWILEQADSGLHLEASEQDLFVVHLEEKSASGYLWELAEELPAVHIEDRQTQLVPEYGSPAGRTVHLRLDPPGVHTIALEHRRPWNDEVAGEVRVSVDNLGSEKAGKPRRIRQLALSEAMA